MTSAQMTRRSLLAAAGGALASRLVHPPRALAALAGPPAATLADRWLGTIPAGLRTVELARSADLLGIEWHAPSDARLHVRFMGGAGRWSEWVSAGAAAHGPDRGPDHAASVGEPVWTGGTRVVQIRSSRPLSGVRLRLVDVSGGVGARRAALVAGRSTVARLASGALPLAEPTLSAAAGQPPILARAAWARGMAHPRVAPEYGAVRLAFVHHTENPNGYLAGEVPAMLRAIFAFHREVRGWNDIGYNFVIDAFGRIFEARAGGIDEPVVGAHAGGYNLVSSGVAVLGSFSGQPISPPARQALQLLLAWKLALHGVPAEGRVTVHVNPAGAVYSRFPANAAVSLPRIAGHRDADTTDCPGDGLYGELGAIRRAAHRLAPRPVVATISLAQATPVPVPAPAPPPAPPNGAQAPAPATVPPAMAGQALTGTLTFLDGTPIAGASVQIQARSVARRGEVVLERVIAQVQSDAAGRWSLPVNVAPAAGHVALRALYAGAVAAAGGPPGAGAAVSVALVLAASTLTPAPAPAPTPAAAPAPAP
jgi:hypothetical protein